MKKRYKLALALVAVSGLSFLGGTAFVVNQLPSPGQLSQSLDGPPPVPATNAAPTSQVGPTPPTAAETAASPEQVERTSIKSIKAALLSLTTADKTDVRVCENLGRSRLADETGKMKNVDLEDFISPESRQDSLAEAFRYPMITLFQDEGFSGLLHDVASEEANTGDKADRDSFFSKVGFYARAAKTVASMYARKEEFEALGDRANHLAVLAKLALRKPDLVGTPALMDICERMEGTLGDVDRDSIRAERKEVLALLAENGVNPMELDFDPNEYMKFKAELTDNKLTFSLSDKDMPAQ